ncbi:hypothetical protein COU60_01485 [Candidatus Pacearchaeota archaeon CG10_big_fil_rev_8_21_14_0_10_34_76]|nr:MAG: hypothetical protein COU60_01485 [Candidatus Pacearchaeota archaeon CG10_big_fil_rev_8_21_14_0_10_34_76]
MNRKGQIAVFVIIAVVIVGLIVLFFAFRGSFGTEGIPSELLPVYSLYSECLNQEVENGISLLQSQGGRINTGEYILGSDYAPFSSHLNFLGFNVPYWYYISGNGIVKENIPSKSQMEEELENYIAERADGCDFSRYYEEGFFIEMGEPRANVRIEDKKVIVEVSNPISVLKGEISARKSQHNIEVESKIGKFYDNARRIYDKQKNDAFLEEYSIDVLRLYAPVDGVEAQCSPMIWKTRDVLDNFQSGLEANLPKLKFNGDYYRLNEKENEYFVVDLDVDEKVQILYSREWPSKIEITPAQQELMIAEPIGNQEGLGAMGFCYIPYHFIYDASFPVMIQIHDGTDVFQFPVAVIIDNNVARQADIPSGGDSTDPEFDSCEFMEGDATIYTFDNSLNPVEADVSYQCLTNKCVLGKTELEGGEAILDAKIPQCLNGYLIARAEGYAEKKQLFSSNSEGVADIVLEKEHKVEITLEVNGKVLGEKEQAVIHFIDNNGRTTSAVIPGNNDLSLSEGTYDVSAFVYGGSEINIPASTKVQCQDVPRSGVLGLFGGSEEQCFNIEIPSTSIDQTLIGGGKETTYLLESELVKGKAVIKVSGFPVVDSLDQLQYNYAALDNQGVDIEFK